MVSTFSSAMQIDIQYIFLNKKNIHGNVVTYLFHDDDEARSRWQTVGHNYICRQEPQTKHLVEQVDGGKEETAQPGVAITP